MNGFIVRDMYGGFLAHVATHVEALNVAMQHSRCREEFATVVRESDGAYFSTEKLEGRWTDGRWHYPLYPQ